MSIPYLNALFDPEMAPHGFPILGTGDVQQALIDTPFHRVVKNLEKLGPDQWLGTTQPREKGRLKLCSQLTARKCLIPVMREGRRRAR